MPLVGETMCLITALLWAVSVTMFRGPIAEHGARTVNLAKCVIGATLQGLTVLALGSAGPLLEIPAGSLVLLAGSGIVGLAVGDTALFAAVARLGAHRTLLLHTLSPVFAAVVAAVWQHEIPSARDAAGATIILLGVVLVVAPGRRRAVSRGHAWAVSGIVLGVLAAFGQGSGLVLAKAGMLDVSVVPASFVRLAAAALGLALLAVVRGRAGRLRALFAARTTITRLVPAALSGTYLALFLMMAGIALAPAAIAAVLLATTPVFSLLLQVVVDGERPTARGVAGTVLAVAGVAVLATG